MAAAVLVHTLPAHCVGSEMWHQENGSLAQEPRFSSLAPWNGRVHGA